MKKLLLLLFTVGCYSQLFAQSTTVNYTELNSYYNTGYTSCGGMFYVSGNQCGQYANGSSCNKQVVSFRQFQTNGTNTGTSPRPLQVGDQFTIATSCIRAYGKIGVALLCSPVHETSWADRGDSSAINVDLDGPQYTGGGYGSWYVRYNGGASPSPAVTSFATNTSGNYHDVVIVFTLTAPDRMNVSITDNNYTPATCNFYDLKLNRSTPITDYCVYLQDDYEPTNNGSKNVYWGLASVNNESVVSTGALSIGAGNNSFTESLVVPNGYYADQTTSGTAYTNVLSKVGTATLTLSGANTYGNTSTSTNINGGVLSVSADNNLGTAPGSASPNINMGGGTLGITSSFTLNANRGINVTSNSFIDVASTDTLTWAGVFGSGTNSLTKTSAGAFTMKGSGGTYGGITVNAGIVRLKGSSGTQMLGNVIVNSGGILRMAANNQFGTTSTPPFISVYGTFDATDAGANSYSQNIALQGSGTITMGSGMLTINNTNVTSPGDIYSGTISGTGGLVKGNTGIEELTGTNTSLTGGITIQRGTILIGNNNAINNNNALTIGSGTTGGTLSTGGYNITVTSISAGTATNTINNNSSTRDSITVNTSSGDTYAGIIVDGTGGGKQGLYKTGTDTLTLSGSNTYTGSTTITQGTLKLGATTTISGSQLVLNGGRLSDNGYSDIFGATIKLKANSSIYLKSTASNVLTFTDSHLIPWTGSTVLTIYNWTGTGGPTSGGATGTSDKIMVGVGGLSITQLAQITFSGFSQGATINTTSGELVPALLTVSGISVASPGSCSTNCQGYVGNLITISGSGLSNVTVVKVGASYATGTSVTFAYASSQITFNAPAASGNIFVYDNINTASSTSTYTDLGYYTTGGNWATGGTWLGGSAPPSTPASAVDAVTIAGNVTLNTSATISKLTILSGTFTSSDGSPRTLTIRNNTGGTVTTLSNSGTWANGTGASTVVFAGSSTHAVSGTVGFYNLSDSSALDPGTATTINATLTLNPGGSIINHAVAYASTSLPVLYYNEGGAGSPKYVASYEWPSTGVVNVYINNNTWVELSSSVSVTGNLYVNGGALQSLGGNTLTMNKTGNDTITIRNQNSPLGAIYGTDNGSGNNLTLSIPSYDTTIFTGDVVNLSTNDDEKKFYNVTVNGKLRLQRGILCKGGAFNMNGILQIDLHGYVQATSGVAPTYATNSLLKYNSGTTYGKAMEWSSGSGAGYPYNVQLSNSTTLDLGANGGSGTAWGIAKNLTIDAGSNMNLATSSMTAALTVLGNVFINGTLTLSTSSGGDFYLNGNWYRSASTGIFTTNGRAVYFTSGNNQYVTVLGGGTETFAFVRINISASGKYLKPNNNLPDTTNIIINGSSGQLLQFNSSGSLDINGRKVGIDHSIDSTNANPNVYIYVPSTITVTDSAGIYNGEFKFFSSTHPNRPHWLTSSVANSSGTGTLIFDNKVLVTIADGQIDFGYSGHSLTNINGVLQVKLGGSVGHTQNPCVYGTSSTLLFANNVDYQVPSTDETWAAGAVTSGAPGIPWNVAVTGVGTNLTINSPRSIRGDISITNDTLTLNSSSGNTFNIGGSWTRTGSLSCFKNNAVAKVVFNGTGVQAITCTANSNVETFNALEIANSSGYVILGGSTNLFITDSLVLTAGYLTTGSGNYVQTIDTCHIKASTGNTNFTVSWINGNLKRNFTNGSSATWLFPIGDGSHGHLATLVCHSLTATGLNSFTAYFGAVGSGSNSQLSAWETSIAGTPETPYISINTGGSWKITPNVQPTSGTYDISLYHNGSSGGFTGMVDNEFAILKRAVGDMSFATFKPAGGTLNAGNGLGRKVSDGYALRLGLSSFSEFAIGQSGSVLPITLVSFTGKNEGSVNNLQWTTASELNTDHFSVQRSSDASVFTELGTVKAAGMSEVALNYSFVDDNPAPGINYYRLGSVDQNGQIEYSNIIAISSGQLPANSVVVYPNPVMGDISFDVNTAAASTLNYSLVDVLGRVIQNGQLSSSSGINHYQLTGYGLAQGIYFLKVSNPQSGLSTTTRLIKAE